MTALAELTGQADALTNPYIERWKEGGGRVIGYYCSYVPEEILHAAGMLPYRMRATGSTGSELGDVYASHVNCTFCRHSLDQAMRGEYRFVDGLVGLQSCDHMSRMLDVWRYGKIDVPHSPFYVRVLSVPYKNAPEAVEWMRNQLEGLRQSLEEHFGVRIGDAELGRSIEIHNQKRRLMDRLYELRKRRAPPISGAEVLSIFIAGSSMPVEEFNSLLTELLKELEERPGISDYRARLLLTGGTLENPEYVRLIEELGGLVVADLLCFGLRASRVVVDENCDPLGALARRYLGHLDCPRMDDFRRRESIRKAVAKEFDVDGIIVQRMKYCDNWGGESAMIQWQTREQGLPCLVLEREYLMSATGQMRTRVQAFLETLEAR
jgi:benzoyl-CoA reductase/2-hydroxyglutaryl-CoA dehydratase subunit BcrC/BadD/HgdB